MENRNQTYDKANSLLEVRRKRDDDSAVFDRIRKLSAELDRAAATDYRSRIVRKACAEAVGAEKPEGRSPFFIRDHALEEIKRVSDADLGRYLFYRYRYEVFPQTHELDNFPPCLQIEPTSICNYRCVFCYQTNSEFTHAPNGYMGMMSLDLFKEVIDQTEGHCEAVTLASRGEPLINKNIEKMLKYASGKFLALKINTHAGFLDEKLAHAILGAEVGTVVFSADAASEQLYSQLRVNGKFDKVIANIERFHKLRETRYSQSRTITRVSGVRYRSEQNLDDMENFWGKLVDQVAFVDYNPWENTYERAVNDVKAPCSDLWRRMFVWWDGRVNPCDVDYKSTLSIGSASKAKVSDLWRSDSYERLRTAHLNQKRREVSPCDRCSFT